MQEFSRNLILRIFRKSVEKINISLIYDSNNATSREDQYNFLTISRSVLRISNVSERRCTENQNTILCSITLCVKMLRSAGRGGGGTDENTAHARCMLDT